jgi:V-type H+-transporting ATPase subunit E
MMNDGDVARQLKQMTDFIRQEAVEKAAEIEAAAAEEFQIEKLQLVEAEKKRIRLEFERNEKQGDIKKKIEYSKQLNASRLEVLQAQDDLAMSMLEAAGKELLYITRDHHVYKNLLRIFIVQVSKVIFASGNLWSCCILFSNNTSMHAISNALTSTSEHTCCKGNTI